MGKNKDRVVALDYFRGICIMVVVINHAAIFSLPFAYITGASRLWTGAAAMLFIISGLTFGVVRGPQIRTNLKMVVKKTFHRAVQIYAMYLIATLATLVIALNFLSHNLPTNIFPDGVPLENLGQVILGIVTLTYSYGWVSFLMYFAVFLMLAPLVTYLLHTKRWYFVPLISLALYLPTSLKPETSGLEWYGIWQLYFVMGLVIARFRLTALGWFFGLKPSIRNSATRVVTATAVSVVAFSALLEFNFNRVIMPLADSGWLPQKAEAGYNYLQIHKPYFDAFLMENRSGLLRPLVALLVLASAYLMYQKHKAWLLKRTGKLVTAFGRDTLAIFMAQAIAIPLLAVLPIPRTLAYNFILTATLMGIMWAVTKRAVAISYFKKAAKRAVKMRYIYRYDTEAS